ncbi:MAG: hypothetical protein J6B01_04840 [Ruminococcus sp.]|nr:hypothetical protein [Ruminococcus sp.]MBO5319119.1 hypothetical protein [Ruminococcus sp.]
MSSKFELVDRYIDHSNDRDFFESLTVEEQVLYKCQIADSLSFIFFAIHELIKEFVEELLAEIKGVFKKDKEGYRMRMNNHFLHLDLECIEVQLHYDKSKKKWVKESEYTGYWYPGVFPCKSYKAAKRHLRKHDEIPKGTKFRLCSKFIGFDRFLVK